MGGEQHRHRNDVERRPAGCGEIDHREALARLVAVVRRGDGDAVLTHQDLVDPDLTHHTELHRSDPRWERFEAADDSLDVEQGRHNRAERAGAHGQGEEDDDRETDHSRGLGTNDELDDADPLSVRGPLQHPDPVLEAVALPGSHVEARAESERRDRLVCTLAHATVAVESRPVADHERATDSAAQQQEHQTREGHHDTGMPLDEDQQDQAQHDPNESGYAFDHGLLKRSRDVVDVGGVPAHEGRASHPPLMDDITPEQPIEHCAAQRRGPTNHQLMRCDAGRERATELKDHKKDERSHEGGVDDTFVEQPVDDQRDRQLAGEHEDRCAHAPEEEAVLASEVGVEPDDQVTHDASAMLDRGQRFVQELGHAWHSP